MTTIIKKEPIVNKEVTINKPTISGLVHNQEFLKESSGRSRYWHTTVHEFSPNSS